MRASWAVSGGPLSGGRGRGSVLLVRRGIGVRPCPSFRGGDAAG
jgi:hypothetical protein